LVGILKRIQANFRHQTAVQDEIFQSVAPEDVAKTYPFELYVQKVHAIGSVQTKVDILQAMRASETPDDPDIWLKKALQDRTLVSMPKDSVLWVHIPANNTSWVHVSRIDLLIKSELLLWIILSDIYGNSHAFEVSLESFH
jgi:hypothetical protein